MRIHLVTYDDAHEVFWGRTLRKLGGIKVDGERFKICVPQSLAQTMCTIAKLEASRGGAKQPKPKNVSDWYF